MTILGFVTYIGTRWAHCRVETLSQSANKNKSLSFVQLCFNLNLKKLVYFAKLNCRSLELCNNKSPYFKLLRPKHTSYSSVKFLCDCNG